MRSIIISPDAGLAKQLESAVSVFSDVTICRRLDHYPPQTELQRTLRVQAPEVVFLSFESPAGAREVIKLIESEAAGVQVVAIHPSCDAAVMRDTMRAGVREFLAPPFERESLSEALRHVKDLVQRRPPSQALTSQIFSFLPSKAGVGTSTLALNISAALAREPDRHVLLSDFDLNSGMLRFMLKIDNEFCVLNAVENAATMDEDMWPQLVTAFGSLDIAHSGGINPNVRIDPAQVRNLIQFARRAYHALCFDMSGNLERYSLEIMQESKRIILVCTPEVPSLHLAKEKMTFLKSAGLDDRIIVVLNRCPKTAVLNKATVEELLRRPVARTFANDYQRVNRAITAGRFVEQDSELGKQFEDFARELLGIAPVSQPETKRKFLDFFAVPSVLQSER
jgi:pilus assembly protein CpaE